MESRLKNRKALMPQRIAFHQNKSSSNKDFRKFCAMDEFQNIKQRIKNKKRRRKTRNGEETCLQSALASPKVKRHRYEKFFHIIF